MDFRNILPMFLIIAFVNGDCSSGVKRCLNDYNQRVQTPSTDKNYLCNQIDNFMRCVFSQGCPIGAEQKQLMIDTTKTAMDTLNCPFTMEDLIMRYGNSASAVSPISTLMFVGISSLALFVKEYFA